MVTLISAICFLVILTITLSTSSTGLKWNCNYPIASNYLYITLAFASIWLFINLLPDITLQNMNMPIYIISIFCIFVLLFVIILMPSKYFVMKHIVWFIYLAAMAYIMKPSLIGNNVVYSVMISFVLFIVLSFLANKFADKISVGWEKYLMMALLGLILVMIVSFFIPRNQNFIYTISYITIGLFALFVMVDTKRILSVDCADPDYIRSSMNLFLDALNIFSAVNNINQ